MATVPSILGRVQSSASRSSWKAAPTRAGIELVWNSGCSRECHCQGHIWRSHCPWAAGSCLAPAPGRSRFAWPWKTIRTSSKVQASWTRSAAFEELPVPKSGFSLNLEHLHGSPGKLGAARGQQRLCLVRSQLGCPCRGEWWHLVAPRRWQRAEGAGKGRKALLLLGIFEGC